MGSSASFSLPLRLLQPEPHVHLAVPRRRGREVFVRVLQVAFALVKPAEKPENGRPERQRGTLAPVIEGGCLR